MSFKQPHQCEFTIDKFSIMGFSRRREPNPVKKLLTMPMGRHLIFLLGIKIPAVSVHKSLCVLIDQEL